MRVSMLQRVLPGLLALLCSLCLVLSATAQTAEDAILFSQRAPGVGPVGIGAAGAGVAGVADYSAFFSNPAGLGYLGESVVGGSFDITAVDNRGTHPGPGFNGWPTDELSTAHGIGTLAYVHKVPTRRGSLVLGAALTQSQTFERTLRFRGQNREHSITQTFLPFDDEYGLDQDGNLDGIFGLPALAFDAGAIEFYPEFLDEDLQGYPWRAAVDFGRSIEQSGTVIEEGRMNEFNLGGAVEAAHGVMVGLSANILFGSYRYMNRFREIDIDTTMDDYIVLLNGEQLEGFEQFELEDRLDVQMRGVGLRGGVSAQVMPALLLGFVLETPTYFFLDEEYRESMRTDFEVGGHLSATDGPFTYEYRIRTPWRLSGGAAFELANISIRADAEFVDWSQLRLEPPTDATVDDREHFDSVNETLRLDYRPVINTRLGADFALGPLVLRGGVAYQPDPFDAEEGAFSRDRTFLSAGLSYRVNQFQIDAGFMQERFDNEFVAYQDVDMGTLVIDEDTRRNRFMLGASFFF